MPNQPAELSAATELFRRTTQKAIARQLTVGELFNGAATLQSMGERRLAAELYKTWIAYNGDNEVLYAIYFNFGTSLNDAGDHAGAINAFRESIRLKPDFEPPYINLGRVLEGLKPVPRLPNVFTVSDSTVIRHQQDVVVCEVWLHRLRWSAAPDFH